MSSFFRPRSLISALTCLFDPVLLPTTSAHAWFAETTPAGEEIFVRLWPSAIFILTHPADWGSTETAQLREGMELAGLLPKGFQVGRLVSVFSTQSAFCRNGPRQGEQSGDGQELDTPRLSLTAILLHPQIFVKEPTATVFFARRHTRNPDSTWLKVRPSFELSVIAELILSCNPSTGRRLLCHLRYRRMRDLHHGLHR